MEVSVVELMWQRETRRVVTRAERRWVERLVWAGEVSVGAEIELPVHEIREREGRRSSMNARRR